MLEQEQEQLNSSLMALTTHFAQVQFRLKQIVTAPGEEKEVIKRVSLNCFSIKYANANSYIFVVAYVLEFVKRIGRVCIPRLSEPE